MKKIILLLVLIIVILAVYSFFFHTTTHPIQESEHSVSHESKLGESLPLWSALPFVGMLLSIALFPIFAAKFWHHHFGKVSAFWSLALAIPFVISYGHAAFHEILHIYLLDYIPFIILLWSLFTISGGILIEGKFKGTPSLNVLFLFIGTVIASWIGTTGASMLLIRPVLRANEDRKSKVHIVIFFIFLVSNIGGALTPLGDPPLFLGFLHGVPFFWTLNLISPLLFASSILLVLFYFFDLRLYRQEKAARMKGTIEQGLREHSAGDDSAPSIRIKGLNNILFLFGVVGSVLMSGLLHLGSFPVFGIMMDMQNLLRDLLLVLMGVLSLHFTPKIIRDGNGFTWFPIKEVAILFAGIFMTIIPALQMLKAGVAGNLGFIIEAVKTPAHYFWGSGLLSSFLDNAPTYLTFLNTELGTFCPGIQEREAIRALIADKAVYLMAISCGAVFMGANTYIGNAPNFMVKSIAEESGVKMPGFFGYMAYSILILIPIFILMTFVFF